MLVAATPKVSLVPASAPPKGVLPKEMPIGSFGVIKSPGQSITGHTVYRAALDTLVNLTIPNCTWNGLHGNILDIELLKPGEKVVIEIA